MTDQYGLPIQGQTCAALHPDVIVGRLAKRLRLESNAKPGVCQICGAILPVVVRVLKDGKATDCAPNSPELKALREEIKRQGGMSKLSVDIIPLPVSACEASARLDLWQRAQQQIADEKRTARVNAAAASGTEYKPTPKGLGWS